MTTHDLNATRQRLKDLGLFGLLGCWESIADKPWLSDVLAIEERERHRRSRERRLRSAAIGAFKPLADFDWSWPSKIDREGVEELMSLSFVERGHNVILLGPNGVGKTMILKNIAYQAVLQGLTAQLTTASDMLTDLAKQESTAALARRLRRYTMPKLLCIDEVGYLSYDNRFADLLFEVVTRRYEAQRAIVLTTNKPFAEWNEVFPHAACTVTLVDRLVHRAEVLEVAAESYRLKEAKELSKTRAERRKTKPGANRGS
jgi:DNA replication protein DnaC